MDFSVTSHLGSWFNGYFPLGRVGCRVEGGFFGYFPLGKLVSGLLPTGGEGGFLGYFPLGKLVSGLLPTGGEGRVL